MTPSLSLAAEETQPPRQGERPLIGGEYIHRGTGVRVGIVEFEMRKGRRTGRVIVRPCDAGYVAFAARPGELEDESGNGLLAVAGAPERPPVRRAKGNVLTGGDHLLED